MRRTRRTGSVLVCGCLAVTAAGAPAGAERGTGLGDPVRVVDDRVPGCPTAEGEPEVLVTPAGTWVAYVAICEPVGVATSVVGVTLLPSDGGPARRVPLPVPAGWHLGPDPELMPDPHGDGAYFAALATGNPEGQGSSVEVFRITPDLVVTRLPSPSAGVGFGVDDKEFGAADTDPGSPWFGRLHLVWSAPVLMYRTWDGQRWRNEREIPGAGRYGDVAVGPGGAVVIAYEAPGGIRVVVSRDGGATFGESVLALAGDDPGRFDPTCARPAVGPRQRVTKGVRVAVDGAGQVHVVAAVGTYAGTPVVSGETGVLRGGASAIRHATSTDGETWTATAVAPPGPDVVQWAPAVARTPDGGVAVDWLQTEGPQQHYDAYLAIRPAGSASFGPPVRLSPASSVFVSTLESRGALVCYGVGDYIGLAPSPRGVVAAWPTEGTVPGSDSDIHVREALLSP